MTDLINGLKKAVKPFLILPDKKYLSILEFNFNLDFKMLKYFFYFFLILKYFYRAIY
jgi:hypothetical protein